MAVPAAHTLFPWQDKCLRLNTHATELISQGQFGRMVCMCGNTVTSTPLSEVAGKLKVVTKEHELIVQGLRMGINFGS